MRIKMPPTRESVTHTVVIGNAKAYITVGLYRDGQPGEIFVRMDREGSLRGGMLDAWATAVSMTLQTGAPLEHVLGKHIGSRFEPSGRTDNPDIPDATSLYDYIARWMLCEWASCE